MLPIPVKNESTAISNAEAEAMLPAFNMQFES
jgi:hypothetical protein